MLSYIILFNNYTNWMMLDEYRVMLPLSGGIKELDVG